MVGSADPFLASERLALTYAHRGSLSLYVDIYPFALATPTILRPRFFRHKHL